MPITPMTFVAAYGPGQPLPAPAGAEVVFAGRSNVGKSSLINRLANRKNLAHVSAMPGKTQTINFYRTGATTIVDLPGYGYAKVSQNQRRQWQTLMNSYFESDRPIALVISLVDIRHPPTELDCQLAAYLEALELPRLIVATKADKLSRAQALRARAAIADALDVAPADVLITSAARPTGIDELRNRIAIATNPEADQGL